MPHTPSASLRNRQFESISLQPRVVRTPVPTSKRLAFKEEDKSPNPFIMPERVRRPMPTPSSARWTARGRSSSSGTSGSPVIRGFMSGTRTMCRAPSPRNVQCDPSIGEPANFQSLSVMTSYGSGSVLAWRWGCCSPCCGSSSARSIWRSRRTITGYFGEEVAVTRGFGARLCLGLPASRTSSHPCRLAIQELPQREILGAGASSVEKLLDIRICGAPAG